MGSKLLELDDRLEMRGEGKGRIKDDSQIFFSQEEQHISNRGGEINPTDLAHIILR